MSTSKLKANAKLFAQVRRELADVLIYGIVMTVSLGLDVHSVVDEKLRLVKKKYPAKLMRSVPPAKNRLYRTIKERYRRR
jgi:NTP pyrophosphatase (non-canonical NTP hydrolase)